MKIIDFEKKGNQVKFYVGSDGLKTWWGDDWNDRPYEHNAGTVYSQFVIGYFVKNFDFDDIVCEPANGANGGNSSWCKEDMLDRKVPCISVLPKEYKDEYSWYDDFNKIVSNEKAINYYFGDIVDETKEKIVYLKEIKEDNLYVQFSFDGPDKMKKMVAEMLSSILKIGANDFYETQFDDDTYAKIETKTLNAYKTLIKKLIVLCYDFYGIEEKDIAKQSLEVKIITGRYVFPKVKDKVYRVCCQSNDNFMLGHIVTK